MWICWEINLSCTIWIVFSLHSSFKGRAAKEEAEMMPSAAQTEPSHLISQLANSPKNCKSLPLGKWRGEGGSVKTKNANLSRGLKMVTHNLTMAKRCLFRKNSNRWEWLDPTHPPQGFRTSKVNLKHFTFFMKKTN